MGGALKGGLGTCSFLVLLSRVRAGGLGSREDAWTSSHSRGDEGLPLPGRAPQPRPQPRPRGSPGGNHPQASWEAAAAPLPHPRCHFATLLRPHGPSLHCGHAHPRHPLCPARAPGPGRAALSGRRSASRALSGPQIPAWAPCCPHRGHVCPLAARPSPQGWRLGALSPGLGTHSWHTAVSGTACERVTHWNRPLVTGFRGWKPVCAGDRAVGRAGGRAHSWVSARIWTNGEQKEKR